MEKPTLHVVTSDGKPASKELELPKNPKFSPGPTTKYPGWSLDDLPTDTLGRSHRSIHCKGRLHLAIDKSRRVLGIPDDYRIAIMPGSDTGALEAALWNLLGAKGVDVLGWENFGLDWVTDICDQMTDLDSRSLTADYGKIPDLSQVDFTRDVVFTWNGTTSGVRVPDGDWIPDDREGLTICDATSAAFAMDLPWDKLDAVTWSWQKCLGGEAQHGMLVLSPRAVNRLLQHIPTWPVPKLFRLIENGKLNEGVFKGLTINTPSMLAVEDVLLALDWAIASGGLPALIQRSKDNFAAFEEWITKSDWADFLAEDPTTRSTTSLCIKITDPIFTALDEEGQWQMVGKMLAWLEEKGAAYDISAYRTAPAGLRLWGGPTVETDDLEAVLPWLDKAWAEVKGE